MFSTGVIRPDRFMQNSLVGIMAQVLAIYGLVAGVMITGQLKEKMALHTAFMQLGAGLAVGLCGLASGLSIGVIGDAGSQYHLSPT
jgi:V-type H+-transporting ATPase 16kDa proteolipid subunit